LFVIFGGALLAIQIPGPVLQFVVMSAASLLALAIFSVEETERPSHSMILKRREEELMGEVRSLAYQNIIDSIHDPILLVRNAKVDAANSSAISMLGDHIIGEDVRVAIRHPVAADRLANPNAEHTGEPILMIGVGSAEQRWELRIHKVSDNLKLVHLSDHSSHYAADRMRTDFVANASHELRTPIAAIKGFLETLQNPEAGEDKETRNRFLQIMFEEADRMQRLIEDLMSLSRIEAARYQLPQESVNLEKLVREVRNFFINSREKSDSAFKVVIPDGISDIKGDHVQLSQLLHNLISNAFKYGGKEEAIEICITPNRSGSMMRLSVTDKGEGIDPSDVPRLTERFYRVDKGRSKAIGGTGLGLSIVKHITERHGGRLEISSELGEGTTFSVLLPVAKDEVPSATLKNQLS